ncbi:YraN family protein [unidentified bacterial endosymbiont]|uniref:YraN family protein n=1 Tax=unidentified bacterial endosymbiont TaxID=2355 RepID=UPI0020A1B85C|nr:YraN family protein [unidentified bacterial endosymbiont]
MGTLLSRPKAFGTLTRRQQGFYYERLARLYLERAGLRFIAANVILRGGEIDLIMQEQQIWIFVEVRYRASNYCGGAIASFTRCKQRCLYQAARVWLFRQGLCLNTTPCRFDLLAFNGDPATVEWIPNAFNANR